MFCPWHKKVTDILRRKFRMNIKLMFPFTNIIMYPWSWPKWIDSWSYDSELWEWLLISASINHPLNTYRTCYCGNTCLLKYVANDLKCRPLCDSVKIYRGNLIHICVNSISQYPYTDVDTLDKHDIVDNKLDNCNIIYIYK